MIEQPYAINEDVFQYYDNKFTSAILYVPKGTKAKYQTTDGWKNFTTIIETDYKEEPKGDANGDGVVDVADIAMIISAMANTSQPTDKTKVFPAYFGGVKLVRQSTTLNEARDGYIYVLSVGAYNDYVVPGLIQPGSTDVEWHLEAAEKIQGTNKYNSAFYLSAEKKWVNCTAYDMYAQDYLLWYNDNVEYGRLTFEEAERLNWDRGYKKDDHWTVHTNRYNLSVTGGILYVTDTVTGKYLGKFTIDDDSTEEYGGQEACDVNGDGKVDVADIATVIDIMAASARELKIEN